MMNKIEKMSAAELRKELERLRASLCDLQEMHDYTFGKTNAHIGAEMANNMQAEYEEECSEHEKKMAVIEQLLKDGESE